MKLFESFSQFFFDKNKNFNKNYHFVGKFYLDILEHNKNEKGQDF